MHAHLEALVELLLVDDGVNEDGLKELKEPHEEQGSQEGAEVKAQLAGGLGHVAHTYQANTAVGTLHSNHCTPD